MKPPPLHEMACLRNALRERMTATGWRWFHHVPRTLGERLDRAHDHFRRAITATQVAAMERVTAQAVHAYRRLFRAR